MGIRAILSGIAPQPLPPPQPQGATNSNPQTNTRPSPNVQQPSEAIRRVTAHHAPAPRAFEQDIERISERVSDTYDRAVRVQFLKPPEQMTYNDYTNAYLRGMFKDTGLSDVSDNEISSFQVDLSRVVGDNFGLNHAVNREVMTERYRAGQRANGDEAVWATNERGRAYVDAGMREIFRDRQARVERIEQARLAGQQEATNMLVDTGKVIPNSAINVANFSLQMLSMQPEYVPGVRDMQGNPVPNPAVPQLPKFEYRSEMFRRDGQTIETGTTLGLAALSVPRSAPQAAPSVVPRGQLLVDAGRTLSAEEASIANMLVRKGHTVRAAAESNVSGVRTADFLVDGVKTELKTITNLTGKDLSASLSRRILDGAGQAPHIIMDVRGQAGMTQQVAERAINRVYGFQQKFSNERIQHIRIVGNNFDVKAPYVASK